MKFAEWIGNPDDLFADFVRFQFYDLSQLPPENRNPARIQLVQYYLAHGFETEALGVIEVVATDDPELGQSPLLMGMRGVGLLGADRIVDADEILMDPILDGDPEMALWRGVLLARENAWGLAHEQFTIAVNGGGRLPGECPHPGESVEGQGGDRNK